MSAEATYLKDDDVVELTAAAALASGQVIQLPDGRAGFVAGTGAGVAAGDLAGVQVEGHVTVQKTTSMVILDGGRVYWDHSANKAHYKTANDRDFYLGTAVGDAAFAATTMVVDLNNRPVYAIDLAGGPTLSQSNWVAEATNGLGVTLLPGGGAQLAFDAVNEAAQAALYSARTLPIASNPIMECRVALFDKGDNAALDINVGLASGSHATDFQSVAEQVSVHLNGNALDLFAESDDGTTDVNETDTTVNVVDDTYFEVWIDCRNPADVQIYVDGALVLGSTVFDLSAATGPIFPIVHMEKTADDTSADFRVDFLRVRTAEQ